MNNTQNNGSYALVTGGSEGIGRAIAHALALRGFNLLIVALPDAKIEEAISEIKGEYGCDVKGLGVDMRVDGADLTILRWVEELDVSVRVLVNNAGFGHLGSFGEFDRNFYHGLLQVNMINVVGLTRVMFDKMQGNGPAWVLNVGSIASFFPIPYKTVYASSKYFIYAFSRALREEFRGTGVNVSLLCPGPVLTNSEVKARIVYAGKLGKMMAQTPEVVGMRAVDQMMRGKWLVLPGLSVRLAWYLNKLLPERMMQQLLAKGFRKKHLNGG